jgi:ArsR family metal-binding transcriptional regulator
LQARVRRLSPLVADEHRLKFLGQGEDRLLDVVAVVAFDET